MKSEVLSPATGAGARLTIAPPATRVIAAVGASEVEGTTEVEGATDGTAEVEGASEVEA